MKISAVVCAALLLCLTSPVASAKRIKVDAEPVAGQGAVLLTFAIDHHFTSFSTPGGGGEIEFEAVGQERPTTYRAPWHDTGATSATVYAASLPPGRYRIATVCAACAKDAEPGNKLPPFTVVAGKTSWLGQVVLAIRYEEEHKKVADRWPSTWTWNGTPDPAAGQHLLDTFFPALAAATTVESGTWEGDTVAATAARLHMRSQSGGLHDPAQFGDDGFLFGARNGTIKRWTPATGLQLIDTGTAIEVSSTIRTEDGQMLAAGDATLLHSNDDGRSWVDAGAGLPTGRILQVRRVGGDEVVFTQLADGKVVLYRGHLADRVWNRIGEYKLEFATWTGIPGQLPELYVRGRTLAMSLPSKRGVYFDLDNGQSHEFDLPGGISSFSYTADGVMRCKCARTLAVNPWESRDLGRTWSESPLDRWQLLPVFHDERQAFTFKNGYLQTRTAEAQVSDDGGATWRATPGKPPSGWTTAALSADGKQMLLVGVVEIDRRFVEAAAVSGDGGTTWTMLPRESPWLYP